MTAIAVREIKVGDRFRFLNDFLKVDDDGSPPKVWTVKSLGIHMATIQASDGTLSEDYPQQFLRDRTLFEYLPTIEERRAALKGGDVITDWELFCPGMKIRKQAADNPESFWLRTICAVNQDHFTQFVADFSTLSGRTRRASSMFMDGRISFAGWDAPAVSVETFVAPYHVEMVLPTTESTYTSYMLPNNVPGVAVSPPPPPAAPFRHHPACEEEHGATLCLRCESLIGLGSSYQDTYQRAVRRIMVQPTPREPWEPNRSGLGGTVGRYRYNGR